MGTPLVGYYSSGEHVAILNESSSNELRLLGNFGHPLESAQRKRPERRGPSDRWLTESIQSGVSALSLSEAFYLAYALGCLTIIDEGTKKELKLATCWSAFRDFYKKSCARLDFALEYGAYHYFRSRNWVIKTGHNYGTHFLIYREGPSIDHAQYAIYIIDDQSPPEWQDLLTLQRVVQSACKKLLLVYIDAGTEKESPSCISHMDITVRTFDIRTNVILTPEKQPPLDSF